MATNYNGQCRQKQCGHYVEWQFWADNYDQPYDCTSCDLQGQSYDITEIAKNCPCKDGSITNELPEPENTPTETKELPF
jgi:hypothetical protein